MTLKRIDKILLERNLAPSRERAQAFVLAGLVYVSGQKVKKSSECYSEEAEIELRGKDHPYVSRGGVKLAAALDCFSIDVTGQVGLDVGVSTGGFTDCLLQRGLSKIYAVDVGYGQIDFRLRNDARVHLFERINFRHWNLAKLAEALGKDKTIERIDLAVVDVSFISLGKILPTLRTFLEPNSKAIVLVKPQFELSPKEVPKGVVRLETLRQKALNIVRQYAEKSGFFILDETQSPILGTQGNTEYFLYLRG